MGLWSEELFGEKPESDIPSDEEVFAEFARKLKDAFAAKELGEVRKQLDEARKELAELHLIKQLIQKFPYLTICSDSGAYCIGCREEHAPAPLLFAVTVEQSGDNPKYLYWEASMGAEADDVPIDVEDLINLINKLQEWRKT